MRGRVTIVFIGAPGSGKTTQALFKEEEGYFHVNREKVMGSRPVELLHSRVQGQPNLVFDFWPLGPETSKEVLEYLLDGGGEVHFLHLTILPRLASQRIAKQHGLAESDPRAKKLISSKMESYGGSFQQVKKLSCRATSWIEIDGSFSEREVRKRIADLKLVKPRNYSKEDQEPQAASTGA